MSEHPKRTTPIRHLFIDTHKLTAPQRGKLVKRLERILGRRYQAEVERPGDGTATVLVQWELEDIEVVGVRVWRLIERVYGPRLLRDDEVVRLKTLYEVLPPPDLRQEVARRETHHQVTGLRLASLLPANAVEVYPLAPDCLNGDHFSPDIADPPAMVSDDLDRECAAYFPAHQTQAKAFFLALDALLRRHLRIFMTETSSRWRGHSCPGDAACAALRYFRDVVEDTLCRSRKAG